MSLVYTVTTCRERLEDIDRFVGANLEAGADHAFVFLDQPDPRALAFLEDHPHATPIVTDDDYWRGRRPASLNTRQTVNANLVRTLLAPLDWAGWLFHLDADETLYADLDVLDRLPAEVRAVRLWPMEAVSTDQPGWSGTYKSLLRPDQLALLHLLGHLPEPRNAAYFHGHHIGKVGIRPGLDLALGIHYATDASGQNVGLEKRPGLRHLHDAATGPEEFIQRWTRHAGHGRGANFKPAARLLRDAFHAILESPAPEQERRALMLELYRRTAADPVDLLHRLGYLTTPKPADRQHQPQSHDQRQHATMDRLLTALLHHDPHDFSLRAGLQKSVAALAGAADEVAATDPDLAGRIRRLTDSYRKQHRPHGVAGAGGHDAGSVRRLASAVRRHIGRN